MKEEIVYKELKHIDDFKQFDVDQEWTSFLQKTTSSDRPASIHTLDTDSRESAPVRRLPFVGMSIAASLILLIGCMYFFNLKSETEIDPIIVEEPAPVEVKTPEPVPVEVELEIAPAPVIVENTPVRDEIGQPEQITPIENTPLAVVESPKPKLPAPEFKRYDIGDLIDLSDGSSVKALAVSTMSIPKSFDDSSVRNIKIRSGFAEFDVTQNVDKAFVVTTLNSEVSVVGTTFSLLSEGVESTVKTIEGLVEFYALSKPEEKVTIKEGEEFKFDGADMVAIAVQEEPEIIENKSTYNLQGVGSLFKSSYPDVKLKRNAIKKAAEMLEVEFPSRVLTKTSPSNLAEIIEILTEKFDMDFEKGDCDTCYSIESIRIKEDK